MQQGGVNVGDIVGIFDGVKSDLVGGPVDETVLE
jgi:hypothetical protein